MLIHKIPISIRYATLFLKKWVQVLLILEEERSRPGADWLNLIDNFRQKRVSRNDLLELWNVKFKLNILTSLGIFC